MDQQSAVLSNALVHNENNSAVLECTLVGPTLKFHSETRIAFTGGKFELIRNGSEAIPMNQPSTMNKGDVLKLVRLMKV